MKNIFLTVVALWIVQTANAQTQTLVLHHADGTSTDVELYVKPRISFVGNKLLVTSPVLNLEYALGDVVRYSFKGEGTAVENIAAEADCEQQNGRLVFNGIAMADRVAVYTTNGVRIPVEVTIESDRAVIPLTALPQGVCLISVNGKTAKFVRP
ncbi:MAG: hypothetical protein IJ559_02785 [Prevotella sp.]|nr:hypothetical protein [Prevotella sp.]